MASKCSPNTCFSNNSPVSAGLYPTLARRYERACKKYPELLKYDEALQATLKGIKVGVQPGKDETDESSSLSFDSLEQATTCLLDTNDHAAEEILAYKEDIRSNDQLYDIVKEYFDLSYKTLDFLFDLQRRLNELKGKLAIFSSSFQHPTSRETKVLALEKFRDCEGFNADLISSLTNVITAHTSFLVKLQGWKDKSEKRINILRRRRKMIYVIFVTVFVCAVVCSILAAAVHVPPLLAAIPAAAATVTSWGPLTSWVENLWKGEESNLQSDVQTAERVKRSNSVVIHELRGIKLSVKALMDQKAILESNTEFVLGTADDNFILNNMKSIMETSRRLIERMDKLDEQVTTCCSGIENRRSEILERIKNGTEPQEAERERNNDSSSSSLEDNDIIKLADGGMQPRSFKLQGLVVLQDELLQSGTSKPWGTLPCTRVPSTSGVPCTRVPSTAGRLSSATTVHADASAADGHWLSPKSAFGFLLLHFLSFLYLQSAGLYLQSVQSAVPVLTRFAWIASGTTPLSRRFKLQELVVLQDELLQSGTSKLWGTLPCTRVPSTSGATSNGDLHAGASAAGADTTAAGLPWLSRTSSGAGTWGACGSAAKIDKITTQANTVQNMIVITFPGVGLFALPALVGLMRKAHGRLLYDIKGRNNKDAAITFSTSRRVKVLHHALHPLLKLFIVGRQFWSSRHACWLRCRLCALWKEYCYAPSYMKGRWEDGEKADLLFSPACESKSIAARDVFAVSLYHNNVHTFSTNFYAKQKVTAAGHWARPWQSQASAC
ncbi:UPF0496 protein [Nymphaea thermarum]|nr:UPF0496 protein [Nymphaea thermarum]